jgi:hypothetical protein
VLTKYGGSKHDFANRPVCSDADVGNQRGDGWPEAL